MASSKANQRPANQRLVAHVRACPSDPRRGVISIGTLRIPCALGRSGVKTRKREGDGATPRACLQPVCLYYRFDQPLRPPSTRLPARIIRPDDGWCDDPASMAYNRRVRRPWRESHEDLWRDDHLYDLVIETDWNRRPRRPFFGSAIFIHLARERYKPTEGCLAVSRKDMRLLLSRLDRIRCFKIG